MRTRTVRLAIGLVAGVLAAVALVWIGRQTVHADADADAAASQSARNDDAYFAGLRAGEAQGRQEGRALQEGAALPKTSRQPVTDAFNAGYTDGMNDAFAGVDGGWDPALPYV